MIQRLTGFALLMSLALAGAGQIALASGTPALPQTPASSASVEGTVVRVGTNEPISGVDVELTRIDESDTYAAAAALSAARAAQLAAGILPSQPTTVNLRLESQYFRTSDDGRFVFNDLRPGTYRLMAARAGGVYTPAEFGQRNPRGRGIPLPIAQDQSVRDIKLEMASTAKISGRVFDADGDPLGHASVLALEATYRYGRRALNIVQAVHTDDRGIYELF